MQGRTDIMPQHVLELLGLEATLDNKAFFTVNATGCTQFGEEEGDDVFGLSVHPLADFSYVGKDGLLVSFAVDGGWHDCVPFPPAN